MHIIFLICEFEMNGRKIGDSNSKLSGYACGRKREWSNISVIE